MSFAISIELTQGVSIMKIKTIKQGLAVLMLVFLFSITSSFLFGDEVTELWTRLYNKAQTYQQKYDVMVNIIEIQNRDIIPTLINALDELMQVVNVNKKDLEIVKKLKILVIRKLGELRAKEAEDLVYDVVKNTNDPFVKSEAIMTLGKIGARKYAQHIAMLLKNLTFYRGAQNVQGQDSIAYACIYTLERIKDPVGFFPVFLAANGGYSRYVKDAAKKALVNIVEDPSDILDGIIRNESSLKLKIAALEAEDNSKASNDKKLEVATTALEIGLSLEPANITEATYLRDLRTGALKMFLKYKLKSDRAVPYIEKILYRSNDISEKIYAIRALSAINSKDSVSALVRFLAYNNDRMEAGISPGDNRLVIETIRAIGATKNPMGSEELLRTKYSNCPAVVAREAEKALRQIGQK